MDWFHALTGFREGSWTQTQRRLSVVEGVLQADGRSTGHQVGHFEMLSLAALREQAARVPSPGRPGSVDIVVGDVQAFHRDTAGHGALFQVASQFNCLEMVSPQVTPEEGVTRYAGDATQGPACAMAAGAATIYRNYLVSCGEGRGQTRDRQLDGSAALRAVMASDLGCRPDDLWQMENGYALFSADGLAQVDDLLARCSDAQRDRYRELLQVGVQWQASVTLPGTPATQRVSQAFCSALPVAYNRERLTRWAGLATLVLEAAYEATLLAGRLNHAQTGNPRVYLTLLGGGAFGNRREWIFAAVERALQRADAAGLAVSIVSYGRPDADLVAFVRDQLAN